VTGKLVLYTSKYRLFDMFKSWVLKLPGFTSEKSRAITKGVVLFATLPWYDLIFIPIGQGLYSGYKPHILGGVCDYL
jgi:hypothetical protein